MEEITQEHIDKLLLFMREEAYKPLTIQELEEAFGIEGSEGFKDFVKALVMMEEKGLVIRTRSNRYGLPEKMNLVRGKLIDMHVALLSLCQKRRKLETMTFSSLLQN